MHVHMKLVDVVAPRARASMLLRDLHRAGVVHLVQFAPPPGVDPAVFAVGETGRESPDRWHWQRRLDELGELLGCMDPSDAPGTLTAELWELPDDELEKRILRLDGPRLTAVGLASERAALDREIDRVGSSRELVRNLLGGAGRVPIPPGYAAVAVVLRAHDRALITLLESELAVTSAGRCGVLKLELDRGHVGAVLVFPATVAREVDALLGGRQLDEVVLPSGLGDLRLPDAMALLDSETERLSARLEEVRAALRELSAGYGAEANALRLVVRDRLAEAHAVSDSAATEHAVVFSGWVPEASLARLRVTLGRTAAVSERVPCAEELADAPVALVNRRPFRAFESLASFVGLPRYGSIDATPFLAITFPLYVGLMVGDAGYGLFAFALLWAVRQRRPASRLMATVWPVGRGAAAWTVLFGILFGEWFGDAGRGLFGVAPIWLDRREAIAPLLVLSAAIGVAQVGLGLALGVVNAVLLGNRRHAVAKLAELAGLAGLLAALGGLAGFAPPAVGVAGAATLGAALLTLLVTVGFLAPVEMLGLAGNVLSYARLMAIGLASVMLAVVANRLGSMAGSVLLGVLIAGSVHVLNIALGFFDATIQGLRLHYVEFFSKFLERGEVRYTPFASALGPGDVDALTSA